MISLCPTVFSEVTALIQFTDAQPDADFGQHFLDIRTTTSYARSPVETQAQLLEMARQRVGAEGDPALTSCCQKQSLQRKQQIAQSGGNANLPTWLVTGANPVTI